MPPETLRALLDEGRRVLAGQGIVTAALDARLLLQAACGVSHEAIISEPGDAVPVAQAERYREMIARRGAHMPVSRIVGAREFYGRSFIVTPAVLDPRPDTETLIEVAVELFRERDSIRFIDLGTGSGAIAVTLLCELPEARGVATDISAEALAVARTNAERQAVTGRLTLLQASWFQGLSGPFDLIVSNPPYIALGDIDGLAPEVRDHDPRLALDGGPDGLEAYRRIAASAAALLARGGHIVVEIGAGQEKETAAVFGACGFRHAASRRDLAGHPRCMVFQSAGEEFAMAQRKVGRPD